MKAEVTDSSYVKRVGGGESLCPLDFSHLNHLKTALQYLSLDNTEKGLLVKDVFLATDSKFQTIVVTLCVIF